MDWNERIEQLRKEGRIEGEIGGGPAASRRAPARRELDRLTRAAIDERGGPSEDEIHAEVIRWRDEHKHRRPALTRLFHPANGEKRDGRTGAKLKRLGVVPGVPDLVLLFPSGRFHWLEIELKAGENDVRDEQLEWLRDSDFLGAAVAVCHSAETAIGAIEEYLDDPKAFISGT